MKMDRIYLSTVASFLILVSPSIGLGQENWLTADRPLRMPA